MFGFDDKEQRAQELLKTAAGQNRVVDETQQALQAGDGLPSPGTSSVGGRQHVNHPEGQ